MEDAANTGLIAWWPAIFASCSVDSAKGRPFISAVHRIVRTSGAQNPKKNLRSVCCGGFGEAPGDDLLLHGLSHTTIGAASFHFRVRDGIGWDHAAVIAEQPFGVAL